MSTKTSTAALASFRRGSPDSQRRAPRHRETNALVRESNKENTMQAMPRPNFLSAVAVVLRIALSLFLWTLGATAMDIRFSPTPPREHRAVIHFPVDPIQAEALQRWVNAGHDPWCRDPELVAAAAVRRLSPQFEEWEPVSLQRESADQTTAVYTLHSADGRSTYRITLRRYRFLLPAARAVRQIIWLPESAEIMTRDSRDSFSGKQDW